MGNPASENVRDISVRLHAAPLDELPPLIEHYADDPRSGVSKAVEVARRRLSNFVVERERTQAMYARQRELGGDGIVVGIDEVGRGALAGPLTVAAVVLPYEPVLVGINDSKQLTPLRREELAHDIRKTATAIGMAHIPPADIDRDGMSKSLFRAMREALDDTGVTPDAVLVDGNPMHLCEQEISVVHGDARIAAIAAASIVAKVTRDARMVKAEDTYPGYGFAFSKGYGSAEHIAAIRANGLTDFHRASFCQGIVSEQETLF